MNTLAIDTCFGACSVAATWGTPLDSAGTSRFERLARGHAERLAPMIEEVMADAPFGFSDLGRIVVTHGPGTFTGQRIGIAAARALSLATGAPVASLSSLAVMAYAAAAELAGSEAAGKVLAVAVDARRGAIYFQAFAGPSWAELGEPVLATPEEAARGLGLSGTVAVGSGAALLAEAAGRLGVPVTARLPALEPDVRFIPEAAIVTSTVAPRPLYLRAPDAKPQQGMAIERLT